MMKKIRVHIADDHPIFVNGLSAVLSSEKNIQVIGFSHSGKEVIKWFKESTADILILDISMPEMDGIAVLQAFKEQDYSPKIIVLSSYDDIKLIKEVLKLGAFGFISKNCVTETIFEAITTVYKGKQFLSEKVKAKLKLEADKENHFANKEILTPREIDVLKLVAKEYSTKEIGEKLYISTSTVETHRKSLLKKIKVKNAVGLALYAINNNLV